MNAATLRGVWKRYPGTDALAGVDLDVPEGSVVGLVGPNGSGKTTLLSVLAGLRRPSEGTVEIAARHVGVLPDTPQFEPWLTGREVVDLSRGLAAPHLPAARVDEALARTGLADAADRRTGGYSRGMLQRLGLAATLVTEPDLYLLDEPSSALDPAGRREVLQLVAELAQGATVLLSSHILADVQQVCDRVAVLLDGQVRWQGAMDDLLVGKATPGLDLRVRPPLNGLVAALRAQPWVDEVHVRGAELLRVEIHDRAVAERELPRVLAQTQTRLVSVHQAAVTLEDVFLELVG